MAQQVINVGASASDGTGDNLRPMGLKANANFTELYAAIAALPETIRDTIAAALVAGTNITITPNDGSDTITITASGGSYTAENARDDIAAALVAGNGVAITVNDAGDSITIAAPQPAYVSGNWYAATFGQALTLGAGATIAANKVRLVPFMVRKAVTITDLGARVTTVSAGGLFRLGIYASDATTLKATGTPLASVGGLSTTTATVVSGSVTPVALSPGVLYWGAVQCDNTTAVFQANAAANAVGSMVIGDASLSNVSSGTNTGISSLDAAATYASGLPDMTALAQSAFSTAAHALLFVKAQ